MRTRRFVSLLLTFLATTFGIAHADAAPTDAPDGPVGNPEGGGPDVIVGDLHDLTRWGSLNGVTAFSVGTISCNVGTTDLLWVASTNQHPVIAQNLYRLKDGRFEQIGQSWLKHGFTALTQNLCGSCNGRGGSVLGVGCSDPYSASLNGDQSRLGPRYQVNPFTGVYPYPVTGVPGPSDLTKRRLQVKNTDLDPDLNPGARYFVEGQYVTNDDALAGNGTNNNSYREVRVTTSGSGQSRTFNLALITSGNNPLRFTQRTKPAIMAWKDVDPEVELTAVAAPGDGLLYIASRVTRRPNGLYDYEYAVQNITSDRGLAGFAVPNPSCAPAQAPGFKDVDYHSGEPYDSQDWVVTEGGGSLRWDTPTNYAQNPNGNAVWWGTLYNYRFTSPNPPARGMATLRFYKPLPRHEDSIRVSLPAPKFRADHNDDGFVDFLDFDAFVADFEAGDPRADFDGDGFTDFFDYDEFVIALETGC